MDKSIQNLRDVVPGRDADAWSFVVRLIRLWEVPLFSTIEMVLIDQNGDKIHATIRKQLDHYSSIQANVPDEYYGGGVP